KAAVGAIQVKRRMDSGQLEKAVVNVKEAKEHLRVMCPERAGRVPLSFFAAVVFFDEKAPRQDDQPSEAYLNCLRRHFSDPASWELAPDLIGSLQHHIYFRDTYGDDSLVYRSCPAEFGGQNVGGQVLLWKVTKALCRPGCDLPFAWPPGLPGREHLV